MKNPLQWCIEKWVLWTGKPVNLSNAPWLDGPMADQYFIGEAFYRQYAQQNGLSITESPENGLIPDFADVLEAREQISQIHPQIIDFYQHTAAYKLEVWSEWYAPVKYFAYMLIKLVSKEMDQLNIPLKPLETSRGMSNVVIALNEPATGAQRYACWLRKSVLTNKVVYAGFYSAVQIKGIPYVKVVFPLPKGSATVLLTVSVQKDRSVKLLSNGHKPGGAGYYRLQSAGNNRIKFKFIPLKESIHVYVDDEGTLRTDHKFWFLGMKLLHLHYKIIHQ